jgi:hypothetical protein
MIYGSRLICGYEVYEAGSSILHNRVSSSTLRQATEVSTKTANKIVLYSELLSKPLSNLKRQIKIAQLSMHRRGVDPRTACYFDRFHTRWRCIPNTTGAYSYPFGFVSHSV